MRYLFSQGYFRNQELDGHYQAVWVMPSRARQHWERQMRTSYADLSEEEKETNRLEADRMMEEFDRIRGSQQPLPLPLVTNEELETLLSSAKGMRKADRDTMYEVLVFVRGMYERERAAR